MTSTQQHRATNEQTKHRVIGVLLVACGHRIVITNAPGAQQCETCSDLWYVGGHDE